MMRFLLVFCALFALLAGSAAAEDLQLSCPLALAKCVNYRATICSDFNRISYTNVDLNPDRHWAVSPADGAMRETAIEFVWGATNDRWTLMRRTNTLRHSVYVNQTNVAFVAEWSGTCTQIVRVHGGSEH